jgi:hypothetical protein
LTASREPITPALVILERFPRYAVLLFRLALAASAQAADLEKADALIEKAIAPDREMDGKVYFSGRYIYAAYGLMPQAYWALSVHQRTQPFQVSGGA